MENFLPPRPGPHGLTSKSRERDLPDQNSSSSVSSRIPHSSGKSVSDLFQSSRVRPSPPGERPPGSSTPTGSGIGRMFSAGNKETPPPEMGKFGRLDNGSTTPQSGSAIPRQKHSFFQAANPTSSRPVATPSPVSVSASDTGNSALGFSGFGRFKSNFFGSSAATVSPPDASPVASKPSSSTGAGGIAPDGAGQGHPVSEERGYDDNNNSEPVRSGAEAKLFSTTTGSSGPAAESEVGKGSPRISGRPTAGTKAPPPASIASGNSFNQDSTRGTGELGTSKAMSHLPPVGRTARPGTRPKSPGTCTGSQQASTRPSAPKLRRPSMPRTDDGAVRNGEMLSSRTERERAYEGSTNGPGLCGGRFGGRRDSDDVTQQPAATMEGLADGRFDESEAVQQPPTTVSSGTKERPPMCDDVRKSPALEQHAKQPVDDSENGGAIVIPDADVDQEDIRVKTLLSAKDASASTTTVKRISIYPHTAVSRPKARREDWIRRKDAAKARFRRECEAEVERIKSLMEEYIAELETRLDGELVDALDDAIGQKMEENQQEKTRARKVKHLLSAFFDDPRIPKSRRLMW